MTTTTSCSTRPPGSWLPVGSGVVDGFVADVLRWARAVRAGYTGDAAESLHHSAGMHDGVLTRLAATPRITAAVQASDTGRARAWTEQVEDFALASGLPWALGVACYGRALLTETVEATVLFEISLRHHVAAGRPYDAARVQLAYGQHLRRAGRRVDARNT